MTNNTHLDLVLALAEHTPSVVVVGLSLANEGLRFTTDLETASELGLDYLAGIDRIVQTAQQSNATVIVGGCAAAVRSCQRAVPATRNDL